MIGLRYILEGVIGVWLNLIYHVHGQTKHLNAWGNA